MIDPALFLTVTIFVTICSFIVGQYRPLVRYQTTGAETSQALNPVIILARSRALGLIGLTAMPSATEAHRQTSIRQPSIPPPAVAVFGRYVKWQKPLAASDGPETRRQTRPL